jgi:hypothetical protein
MVQELYVKAQCSESLVEFVKRLAGLIQSGPWEERESVNYPHGHYFRKYFGPLEIVAQIADDSEYPDADFLIWVRTGEDSSGRMGILSELLAEHGYAATRPKSN